MKAQEKSKNEAEQQAAPEALAPKQDGSAAEKERDAYYEQLLKLKAEFENYRKRVDRERPELYKTGRAEIMLKLLPIYDLLQKVHNEIQASHASSDLAKGMEGVFKEFNKLFAEEEVSAMEPEGKPYDPLKHEVLGTASREGAAEGTVIDVLQAGFMMQDKVLRPARVRIAKKETTQ